MLHSHIRLKFHRFRVTAVTASYFCGFHGVINPYPFSITVIKGVVYVFAFELASVFRSLATTAVRKGKKM